MSSYIEVLGVSKKFISKDTEDVVIDNLSLELTKGDFLSICGKSGSGKTTLLRIISGLLEPDTGSVVIEGRTPRSHYPRVGFVSQDYSRSLFSWFRVDTNVALSLLSTGMKKKQRYEIANTWLAEVGLLDSARKFPWQLSGGMQQRVAIARALATQPKLLCMDEPFGALDAYTRSELQDLVISLSEKHSVTCVLVTHDLDEAIYMSDKILVLSGKGLATRWLEVTLARPRNQQESRADTTFLNVRRTLHELIFGDQ
jgi:NitT/TauT family transport system ATP-binding protein